MNLLIIHQNFPGQFRHIALHMAKQGHSVVGMGTTSAPGLKGIPMVRYTLGCQPTEKLHRSVRILENGVIHGQSAAHSMVKLRQAGFVPDVVLAHPGWGEAFYVKDVFPKTRFVNFCEYFYQAEGADVGFEKGQPVTLEDRIHIRNRNAMLLSSLNACDIGISPTQWQRSCHPLIFQPKINVIHEGVDTFLMQPDPQARFALPNGRILTHGDTVLTYVARSLEPYRGFHVFMRALPNLLARNSNTQVVIVGGDKASYCGKPKNAPNWREAMLKEVGRTLDLNRVHFCGILPYAEYRRLLQISAAHIYLTYPFVLSWSMLEAMSCGCIVIASKTAPVEEVITHGENGLLVDFFNRDALVKQATVVLNQPQAFAGLRSNARETILQRYTVERGLREYATLLQKQASLDANNVLD
jgi:glycosyltransferase involved in cell wall biosynthesis